MSLLVVGSVAIDSIETPWGKAKGVLGGSATYAALAARLWTPVALVAVVGDDFPKQALRLFDRKGIDRRGLLSLPGRTFQWKGRYQLDGQVRTLFLDLGVFEQFRPQLSKSLARVRHAFLGNIHPSLQLAVLNQLRAPKLTACDSRDHWIEQERSAFLKVLKKVDILFLNDAEARLFTGASNLVEATRALLRFGPRVAIVKKGEHGVLAASDGHFFSLPGYPVSRVIDPTGAGDAFAGTCLGLLASQKRKSWKALCQALLTASCTASLVIETFGPKRLIGLTKKDLETRVKGFCVFSGVTLS